MKQRHIEIVYSTIPRLSSLSRESRDAIYKLLKRHYDTVGMSRVDNKRDLESLVILNPDVVFLGMKYLPANIRNSQPIIWLSSYLEQHGIEHTGSEQQAIRLERNKPFAKQRLLDMGLPTATYSVLKAGETYDQNQESTKFPVFVKPATLGGGAGIDENSVVYNIDELQNKIASIRSSYSTDILIEEYLPGREFSVAILRDDDDLFIMPIELIAELNNKGTRVLGREVKSSNTETVKALDSSTLKLRVCDLAKKAFEALGARDYGRIDIRLDKDGNPNFLEANLIPSLIENYGSFPKACVLNNGINQEQMILSIVELALNRNRDRLELTSEPLLPSVLLSDIAFA